MEILNDYYIRNPQYLPEGCRSSFKKRIADSLIESATTKTSLEHTREGRGVVYREQGKKVGKALIVEIAKLEP